MLAAIEFDDQICFNAQEIDYIGSDRRLAAEFVAVEAAVADGEPELAFGFGHIAAEAGGMRADLAADGGHSGRLTLGWCK